MSHKTNKGAGKTTKKNGSIYITLNKLVDMFYVSRFNRDNLHDPAEGEDIDNSYKYRIYNKKDVKEMLAIFAEFFGWAINEKNISKLYITKDITLYRESVPPKIKYATKMDEVFKHGEVKAGDYYLTPGKYMWRLWIEGDTLDRMRELQESDSEFIRIKEELTPEMEEKNKNAKSKDTD